MKLLTVLAALLAPLAFGQPGGKLLPEASSPLGMKYFSIADEKGVVSAARRALSDDPTNLGLILKLARAQAAVWQEREAVATCTRGLSIDPSNADLLIERGHRELPLRDFEKALADLQNAAEFNPKKIDAWYHLGLAHYFLGHFAEAADAFRHAVDAAPNTDERINSTNWLYAALRRANRPKEAAEALAAITPEMTNTEAHTLNYLNLVRLYQGRLTEAQIMPPDPPRDGSDVEAELRFDTVAYGVGNWHLFNGEREKARELFRSVLLGKVWITWGFVAAEREMIANRERP
jgi:tetratricopeptide (TPR) repeat protein